MNDQIIGQTSREYPLLRGIWGDPWTGKFLVIPRGGREEQEGGKSGKIPRGGRGQNRESFIAVPNFPTNLSP